MGMRKDLTAELAAHAATLGLETGYWDVQGHWHDASVDSLVAVLAATGAPIGRLEDASGSLRAHALEFVTRAVPPVVTVVGAAPLTFEVCVEAGREPHLVRIEVTTEAGAHHGWDRITQELPVVDEVEGDGRRWRRRRVEVHPPGGTLPVGYHSMLVQLGREQHEVMVLAAPAAVVQLASTDRMWGAFAPLYSLRSTSGGGANVFDLDVLGAWIHRHGGQVVATLPLLAGFLDQPYDPSPYSPVSRRFWNESYLDVERLPELDASPTARALLDDPATQAGVVALRSSSRFDAAAQSRLLRPLLDELTVAFFAQPASHRRDFDAWVEADPTVVDYGRFRAAVEQSGTGWHQWMGRARLGSLVPEDYDRRVAARHVYGQWSMHRQLGQVAADLAARGQLLYLDLPVGASGEGFDAWIDRASYGWGAAVGAPPDDFFAAGQNWGFPPLRPDRARALGHRHLAACLRHHMTHAGMLRLDHVMGLHRLFWVPDGMSPTDGVYVRSSAEEQFAVVAIESHRSGCAVVGEDLGTVPDVVREAMDRHRVLRSYVAEFAMPSGAGERLGQPDEHTVATVDTHDTPPFASFVAGADLQARFGSGLLSRERSEHELAQRQRSCAALAADLAERGYGLDSGGAGGEGEDPRFLLGGVLEALGDSEARAVLVSLDDLVGSSEPQNVPGTGPERPNWVGRLGATLSELSADEWIEATLAALQSRRLASHGLARELHRHDDPGPDDDREQVP